MEKGGSSVYRYWKSYTNIHTFHYLETTDTNPELFFLIPFHAISIPYWESEAGKAELTVADLADSIEAMLARRESGLPAPTTMSAMRSYPTDPSTQRSAAAFLKQIQEDGKKELAQLDATYKASKQQKADAKAKADADAKEFAEYKANKGAIKS